MKKLTEEDIIQIAALLIHAAKIDENYSEKEKTIVKEFINSTSNNNNNLQKLIFEAEKLEKDSNQLLSFTNAIKNNTNETKSFVIEKLWQIIISDKNIDHFESNLMRRICGLIYFSDKLSGEIKLKIMNKNK
jgi:uncharacterized tellurite resistance protein B-like protein|tara:strand:- start:232 stop:627 length:396 start_codon:yes stop_codon:yes gene_type:complete